MEDVKLLLTASDIRILDQKQNDVFMYVGMRVASTRKNCNDEGVTERFIDSIVDNQEDMYKCLPLYADLPKLKSRRYQSLTHLYDKRTGRFGTTQIGGLCDFYKVEDEYGISLMAEARIPKRDVDICNAILDMYTMGWQNFSFEISYNPMDTVVVDGARYVDASERNVLKGVAVVSVPAYAESTALSLVAEDQGRYEESTADADQINIDGSEPQEALVLVPVEEGVVIMTQEEALQALAEKEALIAEQAGKIAELESAIAEKTEAAQEETPAKTSESNDEETKALAEALEQERASVLEKDALIAEKDSKLAEQDALIASLNESIANLEAMKAELEAIKEEQAQAELKNKQDNLKTFAEKMRLDVAEETVANAIAELDYERLVNMASNVAVDKPEEVEISTAAAGDSMKLTSRFGNLLDRKAI